MAEGSPATCAWCEGFGHHPRGADPGWYQRDWRLLLDPTVEWVRCRACATRRSPLARLHERLSRGAVSRLDAEVAAWKPHGDWRCGTTPDGQTVWRWRDVAVLAPGPKTDHRDWMVLSSLGVQRALEADACRRLLAQLGAPALPAGEGSG